MPTCRFLDFIHKKAHHAYKFILINKVEFIFICFQNIYFIKLGVLNTGGT